MIKPITGIAGCCARAASGQAAAELTTPMKSRRRIAFPKVKLRDLVLQLQQGFATGEMGFRGSLHGSKPELLMSALGQKQTFRNVRAMSALPPIADIGTQSPNVRFVPKADTHRLNRSPRWRGQAASAEWLGQAPWRS